MNKVFLTGADGMLGSSICRELIKQNYQVKAACLNGLHQKNLEGLPIEICYSNILNKEDTFNNMQGCDLVIHVAASTLVWPRRNKLVYDINFIGTSNVMECVEALQIKRFVHIGSASSFDHGDNQNPGDETNLYNGWHYGMDYIDSKFKAQELLLNAFQTKKLPVIIINPTYMIGPFDAGPSSGKMIIGVYKENIPGYSNGGKNFVCSQDVAVAAVNALKLGRLGECYIAGNQNLSYKEFFEKVTQVMNKKFTLKAIPFWMVLMVGAINSVIARIRRKPPQLSYGMANMSNIKQYYSIEKSRKELQMPQTPIEQGIQQCLDWFKANGYLN